MDIKFNLGQFGSFDAAGLQNIFQTAMPTFNNGTKTGLGAMVQNALNVPDADGELTNFNLADINALLTLGGGNNLGVDATTQQYQAFQQQMMMQYNTSMQQYQTGMMGMGIQNQNPMTGQFNVYTQMFEMYMQQMMSAYCTYLQQYEAFKAQMLTEYNNYMTQMQASAGGDANFTAFAQQMNEGMNASVAQADGYMQQFGTELNNYIAQMDGQILQLNTDYQTYEQQMNTEYQNYNQQYELYTQQTRAASGKQTSADTTDTEQITLNSLNNILFNIMNFSNRLSAIDANIADLKTQRAASIQKYEQFLK